jgi:hypothetical protein
MRRFLVFTALFPPLVTLAFVIYITPDVFWRREIPEIGFVFWLLGYAYMFVTIPAWLTAGVDWAFSARPVYLRLFATMSVAAIMAELIARELGQRDMALIAGLMGAIPAAVCSLLSGLKRGHLSGLFTASRQRQ